jgi:MurNAc alpha-1-phosphate uridylyltransferase
MILAAGRGTRLAPITDHTPKPLLDVRGKPLIEHQLDWLAAAGVHEVVINLHHLGAQIAAHLGDGRRHGLSIAWSHEPELLETAGGVRKALPVLGDDPFIILNGDIFTNFDFNDLPRAIPGNLPAHIVVTPTPGFRTHGDFEYEAGRITARGDGVVYCGIAVLHPRFVAHLEPGRPASLARLYFDAIDHGGLSAQLFDGQWTDIGTPDQLRAVQSL